MKTDTTQGSSIDPYSIPLDQIDVSDPELFRNDTIGRYFERLRKEAPVHYRKDGMYGSFWSVTRYKDIVHVDTGHEIYSSQTNSGLSITDRPVEFDRPGFIAMDPPKHDEQRKTVSPIVAPANLARLENDIRARTRVVLDSLPVNETFDWVERVSIEITTQMLATLFDFPFEDRRLLTYWSDVATVDVNAGGPIDSEAARDAEMHKMLGYFTKLWNERVNQEPKPDLISMLAHSPATRNMNTREFLGNIQLLIVGGNDTTRNSMTGGLYFLNQNPEQYQKLRANPALISSMVPEIIRYQTPLSHMKRVALADAELGGRRIKKGDKVIMWYLSGNRDEEAIENPEKFIIDRARPRQHLSFGFGIHRCVGNRLAEMQLRVLWEELLPRYPNVEVVSEPKRIYSNFIHGFSSMMVRIPG